MFENFRFVGHRSAIFARIYER